MLDIISCNLCVFTLIELIANDLLPEFRHSWPCRPQNKTDTGQSSVAPTCLSAVLRMKPTQSAFPLYRVNLRVALVDAGGDCGKEKVEVNDCEVISWRGNSGNANRFHGTKPPRIFVSLLNNK